MKHICIFILLSVVFPTLLAAQQVTNVRARQDGRNIVITYDLSKKAHIRVLIATGHSLQYVELKAVTGEVGKNVSSGQNLQIVWQPLNEYTEFVAENVRFKVEAYSDPVVQKRPKKNWWNSSEFFPHHYLEGYYGLGITGDVQLNNYAGLNYTYIKHALGVQVSGMYGFDNQDIVVTAGPVLTMTNQRNTDLDLQLILGAGYAHALQDDGSRLGTWAVEGGVRFGFDNAIHSRDFSLWSLSVGAKYYNRTVVPTLGISCMPVEGFIELAKKREWVFPEHYTECIGAYAFGNEEGMIGANYSWIQSHLGVYGSFLVGFDGSAAVNAGPVFRLTPDRCAVDLQLYQGIGWAMFDDSTIGGETGLRIGFGSNSKFGMYSFNVGINYSADDIALSFGMSWPILGLLGTLGLGALYY